MARCNCSHYSIPSANPLDSAGCPVHDPKGYAKEKWQTRRSIHLKVLRDLLTLTDAGVELDSVALRELIDEVEAATMPVGTQ